MSPARTCGAVLGVSATLLFGAPVFPAVAVAGKASSTVSAGEVQPSPSALTFERLSPGETGHAFVDLRSSRGSDGRVVSLRATGSGDLADSVTTTVQACPAGWDGDRCPAGAVVLASERRPGDDGGEWLLVPAGGSTRLRVSVTLHDEAVPGEQGTLTYHLVVRENGTGGGGSGGQHDGPGDRTPPGAPGELPRTGAAIGTVAVVAGLALGTGTAMVAGSRRRAEGTGSA